MDIDRYSECLSLSVKEMEDKKLPDAFIRRVERLRGLYAYWLQNPMKSEVEIRQFDSDHFDIGRSQQYEDVTLLKTIIGNLQATSKEFARWRMNQMLEADMAAAREAKDWKALASMQKNYISNNKTDKEDTLDLEFDKIVPQAFEMTDDISIVIPGARKTSRRRLEEIMRKYGKKTEEADFEVIDNA